MKKENKKQLIMLIGKTHSGKTTFAENLNKKFPNLLVLEADPIAIFVKEKFPALSNLDYKKHTGKFKNIALKFKTFLLFLEFGLSLGKTIILSNSNMWDKGRKMVFKLCKKFNYEVIGIYFDYPEEILKSRVKKTDRSKEILRIAKDFDDLLNKQKSRMQEPKSKEFDEFFVIKKEEDIDKIMKSLKNKI